MCYYITQEEFRHSPLIYDNLKPFPALNNTEQVCLYNTSKTGGDEQTVLTFFSPL